MPHTHSLDSMSEISLPSKKRKFDTNSAPKDDEAIRFDICTDEGMHKLNAAIDKFNRDIRLLEDMRNNAIARRDERLRRKINDLSYEWDHVSERYGCGETKPSITPPRGVTLRQHADKLWEDVFELGCNVAHYGVGEPRETDGPAYTGCDCFNV